MKRFLLLLLVAMSLFSSRVQACFYAPEWEGNTSFLIIKPYANDDMAYTGTTFNETVDFWYGYVNQRVGKDVIREYFKNSSVEQFAEHLQTNDFLKLLKNDAFAQKYIKACLLLEAATTESWDYEKDVAKEDAAIAAAQALSGVPAAFEYRVALLKMRVYSVREMFDEIADLWKTKGQNCPDAALRNRMYGYYAHSLFRTGNIMEAFDVYSQLGDERSMSMCIKQFIGYDGIKLLSGEPNGQKMLYYAMQDYANYYYGMGSLLESELMSDEEVETSKDEKRDVNRVKELCLSHQNDADKAMWLNLLAWLEMCDANYAEAAKWAELAQKSGSELARQNAQRILMLSRVKNAAVFVNDKELKQMARDLKTLVELALQEAKHSVSVNEENWYSIYRGEQYACQRPNVCFLLSSYRPALLDYFKNHNMLMGQVITLMLTEDIETRLYGAEDDSEATPYTTSVWSTEWFNMLNNEGNIEDVNKVMQALKTKKGDDAFSKELIKMCQNPEMALADLMGTILMRNGKYSQALSYFKSLSSEYVSTTNYQCYLSTRQYRTYEFFTRTQFDDPEGLRMKDIRNYKAEFCQQMESDILKLASMQGNEKAELELDMANRMFQASYYGDLWAMSDFKWTCYIEQKEDLLCNQARNMLKKALTDVSDSHTKLMIYYGLAVVPTGDEPFWTLNYDWNTEEYTYSFQLFHPARSAYDYLRNHVAESELTSKCDVLKWYIIREGV